MTKPYRKIDWSDLNDIDIMEDMMELERKRGPVAIPTTIHRQHNVIRQQSPMVEKIIREYSTPNGVFQTLKEAASANDTPISTVYKRMASS